MFRCMKAFAFLGLCFLTAAGSYHTAYAAPENPEYQTSSSYFVKVDEDGGGSLYQEPAADAMVIGEVPEGTTYEVLEVIDDSWVRIISNDIEGYFNTTGSATVAEVAGEVKDMSMIMRNQVVETAKTFIGNRYVYGGLDPHKGVDCSGFTRYVMKHVAGVELSHSSRAQANEGRAISEAELRPGDLVFYSNGSRINHVALYAGNGKIVHASNPTNGILVSDMHYRRPVRFVNVLGD